MIPLLIKIQIKRDNKKHRKIWIPLPLLYVPLLILMVICAPLLMIGAIFVLMLKKINLFKAIPAFWALLTSASGFLIDVGSREKRFQITIK